MTRPTSLEYLRERFGSNWVLARRTPRIMARYGDDVVRLTQSQYKAAERDYRKRYGDPHNEVRAELYLAAREVLNVAGKGGGRFTRRAIKRLADAVKAEADAP